MDMDVEKWITSDHFTSVVKCVYQMLKKMTGITTTDFFISVHMAAYL